jgi:dethiobiotin synthetase
MRKNYFISGISTGVGKTVVSVIIAEALQADYWKPIQSGLEEATDTEIVQSLLSNTVSVCHPEAYRLKHPSSPHKSAALEGKKINVQNIRLPETENVLVIEGAGGLMVPLNSRFLMIDLVEKFNAEVILVSQNYLGSINHTLLSLQALKNQNIPVRMLVFNGEPDLYTENAITAFSGITDIFRIKTEKHINKETIKKYADQFVSLFMVQSLKSI